MHVHVIRYHSGPQQSTSRVQWGHCFQIEQLGKHVTKVRQRLETDEEALFIAEEALFIADEVPQHSDDEPLKLHRICDCKIPKKTTHAYQAADQFIITTVKHLSAEVGMHGLRIYLHAIPMTRLLLKCPCLTCLRYESVNMLY